MTDCTCNPNARVTSKSHVIGMRGNIVLWHSNMECPVHGYTRLESTQIYPVRERIWVPIQQIGVIKQMADARKEPRLVKKTLDGTAALVEHTTRFRRDPPHGGGLVHEMFTKEDWE